MKYILIIILSYCFCGAVAQQVVITPNGSGATISIASGTGFGGPFNVQWTNANGFPISNCDYPNCDLEDVEPGRYCVTISSENISDEEECEEDFATVTKCIDIEGSTCTEEPDVLDGEIIVDPSTLCFDDNRGTATFVGTLPPCFGDNVWYEWSNGVTSDYVGHTPNQIKDLGPGTYCLKITSREDVNPNECITKCIGYFCGTIGNRAKPLSVDAEITPHIYCVNTSQVISQGSVTLIISGGLNPTATWINTNQAGNTVSGSGPFCVKVTDDCGSSVTKCFQVPRRGIICPEGPKDKVTEEKEPILSSLNLYPVPTSSTLYVNFDSDITSNVQYQVVNMQGLQLLSSNFDVHEGENEFSLDASVLDEGMYLLRVQHLNPKTFIVIK